MNKDKLEGLVWGTFLGDAYNNNNKLGLYGEQAFWLLSYIKESQVYDPFVFGDIWNKNMSKYNKDKDSASKDTLVNIKSGRSFLSAGSGSHDFSIVGRHAPIIFTLKGMDEMLESIKFHTCLTHMSKETLDASKYIAEVTLAMIYNLDVENTLQERAKFYGKEVEQEVKKAFELKELSSLEAISKLGNGSDMQGALSSTVHLLLKHHKNFDELLQINAQAKGATSARAMVAGMILGARYGFNAIRPQWIEKINHYSILKKLIEER